MSLDLKELEDLCTTAESVSTGTLILDPAHVRELLFRIKNAEAALVQIQFISMQTNPEFSRIFTIAHAALLARWEPILDKED